MATTRTSEFFMPFWIGDFVSHTLDLQAPQIGAYVLLLFHQWRTGNPLPENLDSIIEIARARVFFVDASAIAQASIEHSQNVSLPTDSKEQVRLRAWVFDLLSRFFVPQPGGGWLNTRCAKERIRSQMIVESKSFVGKKGAAVRWDGHTAKRKSAGKTVDALGITYAMANRCHTGLSTSTKASTSTKVASLPAPGERELDSGWPVAESSVISEKKAKTKATSQKRARLPVDELALVEGGSEEVASVAVPSKFVARDTKKGVRPSKTSPAKDERFGPFRDEIFKYWKGIHSDDIKAGLVPADPRWGPRDGQQLNLLLEGFPSLDLRMFVRLLMNRAHSDVAHSDHPYKWVNGLMSFSGGSLDKFGKPKR